MRAADHQLQQSLVVSVMDRAGAPGVQHDVEGSGSGSGSGSGFGFGLGLGLRTLRRFEAAAVSQPHRCRMQRTD